MTAQAPVASDQPRYVIWREWRRLRWSAAIVDGPKVWGPAYTWSRWTRRGIKELAQRKLGIYMRLRQADLMPTPPTPCPEGFHWIGQSFACCDECGLPAWDHEGMAEGDGGLFDGTLKLRPWEPGEREACRAKWGAR